MNGRALVPIQVGLAVVGFAAWLMVLSSGAVRAQQNAPAASGPALSAQEKHGEMLFFQRCSLCHLPPLVGPAGGARLPFGPLLYGYMDNARNAARAAQVIRDGGPQMPGFQYGLSASEVDDIVAYLKSAPMKTAPQWFAEAQKRGADQGRGGGPVD
jgi:mono/diheme cytochrome c family protein